jgi:hypothetical protein
MLSLYVSCSFVALAPSLLATASMFLLFELMAANAVVVLLVFIRLFFVFRGSRRAES